MATMRWAAIGFWMVTAILVSFAAVEAAEPVVLHVATEGDDAWSGRLPHCNAAGSDGPFATIGRAQQAVREMRKDGVLPGPVTVLVRGTHWLQEPIVFRPEDSGSAKAPVVYRADSQEKPLLSGGRKITGWKKVEGSLWAAHVAQPPSAVPGEAASGKSAQPGAAVLHGPKAFRQLFVGGHRARRARSPNEGYFRVAGLVDPKPNAKWNEGVDRFRFFDADLKPWGDLGNVEVVVFHSWNTSRVRIAAVDTAQRVVTFTGPTVFRPLGWDPQQRYYVENAREALDSPGEWYLDAKAGRVYYWPLPGEDMAKVEVVAPVLGELVRFEGRPDEGKFVEYVELDSLRLEHADWTLPDRGYGDAQAAVTVPAALMANGARHCAIRRCQIARVGLYGLWLKRGCKHNRVQECHLFDLGAGGIRIGEERMPTTDATESSDNLVDNNYIHDGGHVYAAGVGLWLAQSSRNRISHNEIHSFDYSGMSLGWNWSDVPTRTLENRVEKNHVHHVVRGVLSDGAGIYTLGTQTGTVIRGNVFHDIFPYSGTPAMAWGIYFDQGSNGLTAEQNVVYHTLTGGIMNTGSPGNVVRNNVFALSGWQAAWRYTWQKEPSSLVERNIFYLTQGDLFHEDGGRDDARSKWDKNVYWRTDGEPLEFYGRSFRQWQAQGLDRQGMVVDPGFVDPARFDFRLRPDSPVQKLGIESIDARDVGLYGRAEWVSLPRQAEFPATVLPKPVEPLVLDEDFEDTPVGQQPRFSRCFVEGRGDSIVVDDARASQGRHSLKFTDAPNLEHFYNPHMFYTPGYRSGRAVLEFDLWREPGAIVAHEWRDSGQPYRVGPSLVIDAAGKLVVGGKALVELPARAWVRIEIACTLGDRSRGRFDVAVAVPGREKSLFPGLSCVSQEFRRLDWLGFTSLAREKTEFRLDRVRLRREPNRP